MAEAIDVREEVNDSVSRKKRHVPIWLPLLRCSVHVD